MGTDRVRSVLDPATSFVKAEAAGGVALLAATAVALVWVNALGAEGYEALWTSELSIGVGEASISQDLRHWVNDGLMTLFFFLISLEIKRELVTGELREPRAAALPIIAAAGGVLVPLLIFSLLAGPGEQAQGWGVPMATDAAFALAVLLLLGSRVPTGLKLLLVTIAVVDDVVAILVIAIAYTDAISLTWLGAAAGGILVILLMRRAGVSSPLAYVPMALVIWAATLESGVHATIAGVALALLTPTGTVRGRKVLEDLEERIHPYVSVVVLPLFALANAGVVLSLSALDGPAGQVALAVAAGLVAGKFIGISLATLGAARLRLSTLPEGVDTRGVLGIAALGGIGFTVSLFIVPLAYQTPALIGGAKMGILGGSLTAAALGVAILLVGRGRHPPAV
jgi:NhaA family Na+:H+ antiporter